MNEPWSGEAFLHAVQGPLEQYPPIRVMFLIHRLQARGRLVLRWQAGRTEIDVDNGQVIGCTGAPRLLKRLGIEGSASADLTELLGLAIRAGTAPDQALLAAAEGLGDLLAATVGLSGGAVEFVPDAPRRGVPMMLPVPISRIISDGLRRARHAEQVRLKLSPLANRRVVLRAPIDTPESRWGLPPVALRLVRRAEAQPTLSLLLRTAEGTGREEEWYAVDLLLQLGMIALVDAAPAAAPAPAPAPPAAAAPEPTVDPAVVLLADLQATLERQRGQKPWEVLGIDSHLQVNDAELDRAQRKMSARYHPDRYAGQSREAQDLAAQCFALVMEAHGQMRDTGLRTELKARLEASSRGEKFVTDRDRQEAEMAYARGQVAFRRRSWPEALAAFDEALALDPSPWRYTAMQARSAYHAGLRDGISVATQLADLDGPRGAAKAEVLFEASEILARDNEEERALALCHRIVEIYPEHIGARRRIRLRDLRTTQQRAEEASASGSFLGSLFGRRKR